MSGIFYFKLLSVHIEFVSGVFERGKAWPVLKADNLTAICELIV
jgi:hypothetical protein